MAKKKLPQQEKMVNYLAEMLEQINPEDLENMFQLFTDQLADLENYPHITYSYQHPDYAKKSRPVAKYLHPIELLGWDFDISETFIGELLSRPNEQLADELENLILNHLAIFHQSSDDELPLVQSKFVITLLLLKEIGSPKSLDIVLEVLRQNSPFLDTYFQDMGGEIFPLIIYRLASDQLPKLLEFMKEPGILPFGKVYVAMAVSNIACTTPKRRLEVISWFCQVLNFFYEHIEDEAIFDGIIIDSIAFDIMSIHGKEVLPLLEKLYATNLIMPFLAPDIEGIRERINEVDPTKLDDSSIYQTLKELHAIYSASDDDEDETALAFKEPQEEKCFTIRISLQNIEPEIWRLVEIPSSLTLPQVHEVIQSTMGWEDNHLHQFTKGNTCYMQEEEIENRLQYSRSNCVDYTDVEIGELLTRKRSKICYEYDFGDGWKHDIILEEQRPYKKNERPRIFLLDGANACPPEDCGGCYGYMNLIEAMKHKRSKAYKEYIDWIGEPFDPSAFDKEEIEDINEELEGIF